MYAYVCLSCPYLMCLAPVHPVLPVLSAAVTQQLTCLMSLAPVYPKRIATLLAERRGQPFSKTIGWIQCVLNFPLIRSAIQCLYWCIVLCLYWCIVFRLALIDTIDTIRVNSVHDHAMYPRPSSLRITRGGEGLVR